MDLLFGLQKRRGTTLLLITHDAPWRSAAGGRCTWRTGASPRWSRRDRARFALRELRGGARGTLRSLGVVLLCLAIGVAAIAAVGSLRDGIARGLARDGRALLGGDIDVATGGEAPPAGLRAWLEARGARVSGIVEMRSLLVAPSGARALVELKAADAAYPLAGAVTLDPASPLQAALAGDRRLGLVADGLILQRLGLHVGDRAKLGQRRVRVAGTILAEPDRISRGMLFAPRVIIPVAALPATGLIQPGSLVTYNAARRPSARHRCEPGRGRPARAFPDGGWRIRLAGEAAPGAERFVDQLGLFLTLVGLTALLVGGIGVANGVRAWTEARARSIAVLRCLGASSGLVLATVLIQVLALCAVASSPAWPWARRCRPWRSRSTGTRFQSRPRSACIPGHSCSPPLRVADGRGLCALARGAGRPHPRCRPVPRRDRAPGVRPRPGCG